MVFQPVCRVKSPSGALRSDLYYCQTFSGLLMWVPSLLTRQVLDFKLLLALVSTVILRSESHENNGHTLISQIKDSPSLGDQVPIFMPPWNGVPQLYPQAWVPFWLPSNLPQCEEFKWLQLLTGPGYNVLAWSEQKMSLPFLLCSPVAMETRLFGKLLFSNGCCIVSWSAPSNGSTCHITSQAKCTETSGTHMQHSALWAFIYSGAFFLYLLWVLHYVIKL
jgi:hypothetical protein